MPGYADRTWGAEADLSADRNTYLRDNLRRLYYPVAYVEITSDVTLPDGGAEQDVVSSGAITYKGTPIRVAFYCPRVDSPADGGYVLSLWDDVTELGDVWVAAAGTPLGVPGTAAPSPAGVYFEVPEFTPTAASHTYKIRGRTLNATGSDAVTMQAGSAGANLFDSIYIRVEERGG